MNEISRSEYVTFVKHLNYHKITPPILYGTRQNKQALLRQLKRYFIIRLSWDEAFVEFHPVIVAPAVRFSLLSREWQIQCAEKWLRPPLHPRPPVDHRPTLRNRPTLLNPPESERCIGNSRNHSS